MARLRAAYAVSERRACRTLAFPRATQRYTSTRAAQDALRLRDLAATRVRYGYRRLHVLLRREEWAVNHKRAYRLYREEGLTMKRKAPRRRAACPPRTTRTAAGAADQVWAVGFVRDALADGRRFRVLTILDVFTRECLALRAGFKLACGDVATALDELKTRRGVPWNIRVDNGPEFAGKTLDLGAYFDTVALDFSRPGKPTDNAFIESFNGRFRQECLSPR